MTEPKKLFTQLKSREADEAKAYMTRHREGEYTLLDVRQPGEYEEGHLPGAKLMPLPQLPGITRSFRETGLGGRSARAETL